MNLKKIRANDALVYVSNHIKFNTVLDIGCGYGQHSDYFSSVGKSVTSTDIMPYYNKSVVLGDYMDLNFKPHDLTWASHVLEHQLNTNLFLKKLRKETKNGGYTCITVPPLKHDIVGGHVSLWNAGLLMYNLVLAGFNCKHARIKKYKYNISVIAQAEEFTLPKLNYDSGDIKKLQPWLPNFCSEPFNGDIMSWNWNE